jgi:3-hydroxyisobutyrate dehydrogenase-like beta-hydroxyacid dehydrogenase
MGSRIAARLLDAGHEIVVWNRSEEKAKALVDRGAARRAPSRPQTLRREQMQRSRC